MPCYLAESRRLFASRREGMERLSRCRGISRNAAGRTTKGTKGTKVTARHSRNQSRAVSSDQRWHERDTNAPANTCQKNKLRRVSVTKERKMRRSRKPIKDVVRGLRDLRVFVVCYLARGSGRTWKCIAIGGVPLPVSMWNGTRLLTVDHSPRPFQPPAGLSMRPSIHFV
jgi:hypothetical protein